MNPTLRQLLIPAILAGVLAILMLKPFSASAAMPAASPEAQPPSAPSTVPAAASNGIGVVEHLRLRVPASGRSAWLRAERECWDPWLRRQPGFLGRELYWNAEREEGVLLIRWANQQVWDAIPKAEIDAVQQRFEASARRALGGAAASNPFPLLDSGSLMPMGQT